MIYIAYASLTPLHPLAPSHLLAPHILAAADSAQRDGCIRIGEAYWPLEASSHSGNMIAFWTHVCILEGMLAFQKHVRILEILYDI